jgi:hypothetical protein
MYAASTRCYLTCHQLSCPPDTLTVLKLHLQTSHGHFMRTLTAVLVLRSSCSSVGCGIVHPVMHKVLHFTAVAATSLAPTETIRSTAAAYTAATSAEASAVGFLNSDCGSGK